MLKNRVFEQAVGVLLLYVHYSISFICSSHSTEAIAPNKAYLWPGSKCWMRASGANIQHAATKVTNMPY